VFSAVAACSLLLVKLTGQSTTLRVAVNKWILRGIFVRREWRQEDERYEVLTAVLLSIWVF
jgi:hypothetical protein